ncbi:MAG: T9SS type A sorting domain-containing protein, partial [Chitinophagaceae bacterium]
NIQLRLMDVEGKLMKLVTATLLQGTNTINLDLSGLASGLYFINAVSKNGTTNVLRLLKQ